MHHPKDFDHIPVLEVSAVIRLATFAAPKRKAGWGDLGALPRTDQQDHVREAGEPNIQWFLVSIHRFVLLHTNWLLGERTEQHEADENIALPGYGISRLGCQRQIFLHSESLSFSLGAPPILFAPSIS